MVAVGAGEGSATRLGRWLGRAVRVAFALLLLGGLLGAALTSARREPLTALRDDFAAGLVSEVSFDDESGLLPLHLQHGGDPRPAVRWKVTGSGWRSASLAGAGPEVVLDPGGAGFGTLDPDATDADATGPDATDAAGTDAATGTDAAQTPVGVAIQRRAAAAGVPVSTLTPHVPRLLISLSLIAAVLLVLVLIGAPQPRRATKWAWFWLMTVPGGVTQLVWLAVEAPWSERANRMPEPRPHRDQPGDRRLTGGRSLLLSVVLSAVIGWLGWRIGGWLAG